jgi:hypothetical protein
MANIPTKALLAEVIEDSQAFDKWKIILQANSVSKLNLDSRMEYVLAGVHIGVLPATACRLCGVTESDMQEWYTKPSNAHRMEEANGFVEASLEVVVYQAALKAPFLAVSLLEKRNPKRWMPLGETKAVKGRKAASMSEILANKARGEMVKKEMGGDFDVNG